MPGDEKFPRSERLSSRSQYQEVYRHGTKTLGPEFICYIVRHEGQGRKFGLAVSRAVGGAVVRNRVKRYIREAYRAQRKHLVEDVTVVIVARKVAAAMNYEECSNAILRLFRNGGVLSE